MRINDKQFVTADQSDKASDSKKTTTARQTGKETVTVQQAQAPVSDSVQLSSRARDVADIKNQLKDSADVREDLVNDIRERIKNGSYHVDSRDIASSIVRKAEEGIF